MTDTTGRPGTAEEIRPVDKNSETMAAALGGGVRQKHQTQRRRTKPTKTTDATRGWDAVLAALFFTWIVAAAINVAHGVRTWLIATRFEQDPTSNLTEALLGLERLDTALWVVGIVLALITVVVLANWAIRVRRELEAAGRTIGWAAERAGMWWFIPIANAFVPYMALHQLWAASADPRTRWQTYRRGNGTGLGLLLSWAILLVSSEALVRLCSVGDGSISALITAAAAYTFGSILLLAVPVPATSYVVVLTQRARAVRTAHREQRPVTSAPLQADSPMPWSDSADQEVPKAEERDERPLAPSRPRLWLVVTMSGIAGLALFIGIVAGIVTAPAATSGESTNLVAGIGDEEIERRTVSYAGLATGDCIPSDAEFGTVTLALPVVSCNDPHRYEVFRTDLLGGSSQLYNEDHVFERASRRCLEAFEARYGVNNLESPYEVWNFYPSEADWRLGDRRFVCIADSGIALRGQLDADRAAGPIGPNRLVSSWALVEGDCIKGDPWTGLVSSVSCSAPHDWEVSSVRDLDGDIDDADAQERLFKLCPTAADALLETRPVGTIGVWDGLYTGEALRGTFGLGLMICVVEKP